MARGFKQCRYAGIRMGTVGVYAEHSRSTAGARADSPAAEGIALDWDDWHAADRREVLLLHSARRQPESASAAGAPGRAWKRSHAGGCESACGRRNGCA